LAAALTAADAMTMGGKSAATVNGAMLAITTPHGVVLNDANKLITTDIDCSNGVIHVVDSVMLPA
jgi:uncharacterized surface protein with fasciclin (FAS1) repeats